jgi:hypothetical protein
MMPGNRLQVVTMLHLRSFSRAKKSDFVWKQCHTGLQMIVIAHGFYSRFSTAVVIWALIIHEEDYLCFQVVCNI